MSPEQPDPAPTHTETDRVPPPVETITRLIPGPARAAPRAHGSHPLAKLWSGNSRTSRLSRQTCLPSIL